MLNWPGEIKLFCSMYLAWDTVVVKATIGDLIQRKIQ